MSPDNSAAGRSLIGPGDLITATWEFIKKNLGKLALISIVPAIGTILLGIAIGAALMLSVSPIYSGQSAEFSMAWFLLIFPLILILIILQSWIQVATLKAIDLLHTGTAFTFKSLYSSAWKILGKYWKTTLLASFVAFAGFVLFVIPGIIFSVWFSFTVYILVNEGISGRMALLKSRNYVRGYWWPVFGRMLILVLLVIGVQILTELVQIIPILGIIIALAVGLVMSFLPQVYLYFLYNSLKTVHPIPDFQPSKRSEKLLLVGGLAFPLIFILGFLFVFLLAFINPNRQFSQANDAKRQMDTSAIRSALADYYDQNSRYPASLEELAPAFIFQVPTDPDNQPYSYQQTTDESYVLCAGYENPLPSHPDCVTVQQPLNTPDPFLQY